MVTIALICAQIVLFANESSTTNIKPPVSVTETKPAAQAKPAPAAVPVLSQDEAIKANEEAIRFQRNKENKARIARLKNWSIDFLKKYSTLIILIIVVIAYECYIKIDSTSSQKPCVSSRKSAIVRHAVCIILFLFGMQIFVPWQVFFGNASNFTFVFSDFVGINLLLFFLSALLLCFIAFIIPHKISNVFTAILAGLGLCFYFQAMYMNIYLGTMNGIETGYQHYIWGIINLVIWVVIALLPLFVRLFLPSHFRTVVLLASIVLGLELLSVSSLVLSAPNQVLHHHYDSYCDASDQFKLSKKKNILVFIFDALSSEFSQDCFKKDPSLKEAMKDFIWYKDALSNYNLTFLALPHEMTGCMVRPAKNQKEMYYNLWHSPSAKSFYKQVKNAGYDCRMYVKCGNNIGPYDLFDEYFSNVKKIDSVYYHVDKFKLARCLVQMSGFSGVPYLLKKAFFYGDDFSNGVVRRLTRQRAAQKAVPVENTNDRLYSKLISNGITTDSDSPVFAFHYTRGAHGPWVVDEKCQLHDSRFDSCLPSAAGCYFFISELIRQLKEKNIYDQTAIIVCSDHGLGLYNNGIYSMYAMTFMVKPFFTRNKSMSLDYSKIQSIDILPTLLQLACGDKADFTGFEGFSPSNIPLKRERALYRGLRNGSPFMGIDGMPYEYNNLEEYVVNPNDSYDIICQCVIPLNIDAKLSDSK